MHTFKAKTRLLLSALILVLGSLVPGQQALANTSSVHGTITSPNGPIGDGVIYFFASCADYRTDKWAASNNYLANGNYFLQVADGTYLARLYPRHGYGASHSWHSAKGSCETADPITVLGDTTVNLVAQGGFAVSGTVTATEPVSSGELFFYSSCQDVAQDEWHSQAGVSGGTFALTLAPGSYRVRIKPDQGTAGLESWNGAAQTCAGSTPITVTGADVVNLTGVPGAVLRGSVSSSNGTIQAGEVSFWAACTDYVNGQPSARVPINSGSYVATVPNGTYRVHIQTGLSDGAMTSSWHQARGTCEEADPVSVNGSMSLDVVARPRSQVAGTVTSAAGPVSTGKVTFYTSCEVYERGGLVYSSDVANGRYSAYMPDGVYRAFVQPDKTSGARRSWHNAKLTCDVADLVVVSGNSTVNLVAAITPSATPQPTSSTPPPPPPPTMLVNQSVQAPPKTVRKGKRVKLAVTTEQGARLRWSSKSKKVCTVKKSTVKAIRKGRCRLGAAAPSTGRFAAYGATFTIRVT